MNGGHQQQSNTAIFTAAVIVIPALFGVYSFLTLKDYPDNAAPNTTKKVTSSVQKKSSPPPYSTKIPKRSRPLPKGVPPFRKYTRVKNVTYISILPPFTCGLVEPHLEHNWLPNTTKLIISPTQPRYDHQASTDYYVFYYHALDPACAGFTSYKVTKITQQVTTFNVPHLNCLYFDRGAAHYILTVKTRIDEGFAGEIIEISLSPSSNKKEYILVYGIFKNTDAICKK